ncbi:hypothetical protein E2C01_096894 [Portunus trituberculatus]|uniref:Uncharacterized protein n=1 Tax=Portunus trituberculatus TaxID=210409 RepID=A0A5B7JWU6_PORTR|nr:hypothetical protein [Portunus trituberculatus]
MTSTHFRGKFQELYRFSWLTLSDLCGNWQLSGPFFFTLCCPWPVFVCKIKKTPLYSIPLLIFFPLPPIPPHSLHTPPSATASSHYIPPPAPQLPSHQLSSRNTASTSSSFPPPPATQHPVPLLLPSPFPPGGRNDGLNTPASHNETHVLPRCSTLHSARRGSAHQLDPLM